MSTAWRPEALERSSGSLKATTLPTVLPPAATRHSLSSCNALQISLDTRDILIEATATDLTKAHVVVSTLCAMFGEYCSTPYEVEPVEVVSPGGQVTGEGVAQGASPHLHSNH